MTDTYVWVPQTGTVAFRTAAAWQDASSGLGPPAGPPGPNDIAIINAQNATIDGSGTVGALSLGGSLTFLGTAGTTELTVLGLPGVTQDTSQANLTIAGQAGASEILNYASADATLALAAPTTILAGGTLLEAGTASLGSTLTVDGGSLSATDLTVDLGAELLLNSGSTLPAEFLQINSGGTVTAVGSVSVGAFLRMQPGSTLAISGTGGSPGAGTFVLDEPGFAAGPVLGAGLIDAAIVNDVSALPPGHDLPPSSNIGIYAGGGTLTLEGPVSGTGAFEIDQGAALAFAQSDSDASDIYFGPDATLIVQSAAPFASVLNDFLVGDAIDLPSLPYATGSTTISYADNEITVSDPGGETITLPYSPMSTPGTYTGSYNGGTNFFLEPDNDGGSYVSLLPLPPSSDPRQALLFATLGGLQYSTFPGPAHAVIWSAGSSPDPAQSGDFNVAIATVGGGTLDAPLGYQAAVLTGTAPTLLFGPASGNALLFGGNGADTLVGAVGDDTLLGGAGNLLYAANGVRVQAGSGVETIVAAAGPNTVQSGGGGMLAFLDGGQNQATAAAGDTIVAGAGGVTVQAASGALVFGGGGSLSVTSTGADTIIGGGGGLSVTSTGADTIDGGAGALFVHDNGSDTIYGGSGAMTVLGGLGGTPTDPEVIHGAGGAVTVLAGSAGTPTGPEVVQAGTGPMLFAGGSYADVYGGAGSDTIFGGIGGGFIAAGPNDTVVAGSGVDSILGAATTVTGAPGAQIWFQGRVSNVFVAGSGNETLSAANGNGDNLLFAGSGADTLIGEGGADTFDGGGSDRFVAGTGNALFVAGIGADLFEFANGFAGGSDTIAGFRPGTDHVALYGYSSYTLVPGASETLLLPDGTKITFAGVNGLGANAFS